MIVRSIVVEGWGCFADRISIGLLDEGITVIHGPNGTGKSTLLDAVVRALTENHKVGGDQAQILRPWGRSLAPKAVVEFSAEDKEYRLTKRLFDQPCSLLERKEQGAWRRFVEGTAADEWLRNALRCEARKSGLAQPENWGIASVLLAPQGRLELDAIPEGAVTDLHASLGAQISGGLGAKLEKKIAEAYDSFFTGTGRLKSGKNAPRAVQLAVELDEANKRLQSARDQMAEFERYDEVIAALEARERVAAANSDKLAADVTKTQTEAAEYTRLVGDKQQCEARFREAEARLRALRTQIGSIETCRRTATEAAAEIGEIETNLPAANLELEAAKLACADTRKNLEACAGAKAGAMALRATAAAAREFQTDAANLSEVRSRIAAVRERDAQIRDNEERVRTMNAPSAKDVDRLDRAMQARDRAETLLDAALLKVDFTPDVDCMVDVTAGDQTGRVQMSAGLSTTISGTRIDFHVPGFGRVCVRGPVGDVEAPRRDRDAAASTIAEITEKFGGDLPELKNRLRTADELSQSLRELASNRDLLLDGAAIEDLCAVAAAAESRIKTLIGQHAWWATEPPDAARLDRQAAAIDEANQAAEKQALLKFQEAQQRLQRAESQLAALHAKQQSEAKRKVEADQHVSELCADGKSDAERHDDLSSAALVWHASDTAVHELERQLAAFTGDPVVRVAALEAEATRAADEVRKIAQDLAVQRGLAHRASEEAPYQALTQAEELVAKLESDLEDENERMAALRLLHETVVRCRDTAVDSIAGPIEERANTFLNRIWRASDRTIAVNSAFVPYTMHAPDCDGGVAVGRLSGGEKEQVFFSTRLALALELAQKDRQVVVFDDVFAATDQQRLDEVLRILEESTGSLQVIVLTCHPERYASLAHARFIDLAAMKNGHPAGAAA